MSEQQSSEHPSPEGSSANQQGSNVTPVSFQQGPSRKGLKKGVYLLPNLVTTGALFSGFYAIIAAVNSTWEAACIAIIIAAFLDALDGRIARLTKTQSEFGVQFDSMSDLVAFGVAPAILLFGWVLADLGKIGWVVSFLYMACAAMRLARFNTSPDSSVFYGLASPAAACTVATGVWLWVDGLPPIDSQLVAAGVAALACLLGLLMVSNVRYFSPKTVKARVPFRYMLLAVLLFIVILIYPPGALFLLMVFYALSGPVQFIHRLIAERQKPAAEESSS